MLELRRSYDEKFNKLKYPLRHSSNTTNINQIQAYLIWWYSYPHWSDSWSLPKDLELPPKQFDIRKIIGRQN